MAHGLLARHVVLRAADSPPVRPDAAAFAAMQLPGSSHLFTFWLVHRARTMSLPDAMSPLLSGLHVVQTVRHYTRGEVEQDVNCVGISQDRTYAGSGIDFRGRG